MTVGQQEKTAKILETACRVGQIPMDVLVGKTRPQYVVDLRHAAMYCCRMYAGLLLRDIGSVFSRRNHATVIHGCNRVGAHLDTPECRVEFQEVVDAVRLELCIPKAGA